MSGCPLCDAVKVWQENNAALPPVRSEPLLAGFRDGWIACRRKMIAEYGEASRSGCDPDGAWDCAKEGTAEPDTANRVI